MKQFLIMSFLFFMPITSLYGGELAVLLPKIGVFEEIKRTLSPSGIKRRLGEWSESFPEVVRPFIKFITILFFIGVMIMLMALIFFIAMVLMR